MVLNYLWINGFYVSDLDDLDLNGFWTCIGLLIPVNLQSKTNKRHDELFD
jgi:hypothetical protein